MIYFITVPLVAPVFDSFLFLFYFRNLVSSGGRTRGAPDPISEIIRPTLLTERCGIRSDG